MPNNKEDINRLYNDLLKRSIAYIELYSIEQMDNTKLHIEKINKWLDKSNDPNDIQKLTTSLKSLNDLYAFLLEQSTTRFMAGVIPMSNLIKDLEKDDNDSETTVTESLAISTKKISDDDLKAMYQKYED